MIATLTCASVLCSTDAPWASKTPLREPELFAPGAISTGEYDSHAVFEPDGSAVWFLKSTPQFDFWTIVRSRRQGESWSAPEVAPFSGRYSDADPCLSHDGRSLWFLSNRPVEGDAPNDDLDLWFVERKGDGWGEPKNAGTPINSPGNEWFPSFASDGTLYFGSDRPGGVGRTDVWRSKLVDGRYGEPENLGESVNSKADDFEGCIAADQSFLIVMSTRRGGPGGAGDLWISERSGDAFAPAHCIEGGVSTPAGEIGPRLSPDEKYLFFSSTRSFTAMPLEKRMDSAELSKRLNGPGNGLGDVFRVEIGTILAR